MEEEDQITHLLQLEETSNSEDILSMCAGSYKILLVVSSTMCFVFTSFTLKRVPVLNCNYTELYLCPVQHEKTNFVFEAPKAVIRDVFSWSYCCYGNLLCQVNYVCISMCSPLIGQFYRYHDCTIK